MKRVKWGSVHSRSLLAVGNKESIFRQSSSILLETNRLKFAHSKSMRQVSSICLIKTFGTLMSILSQKLHIHFYRDIIFDR